MLANLHTISLSLDKGTTFHAITGPTKLTSVSSAAIDKSGNLWIGGREGVWYSQDDGGTWKTVHDLFVPDVSSIFFDGVGDRVLVTANPPNTIIFSVHTPDMKVSYLDTGWHLRGARPAGDHLVGITPYEGVVLQPKMVDSAELTHGTK